MRRDLAWHESVSKTISGYAAVFTPFLLLALNITIPAAQRDAAAQQVCVDTTVKFIDARLNLARAVGSGTTPSTIADGQAKLEALAAAVGKTCSLAGITLPDNVARAVERNAPDSASEAAPSSATAPSRVATGEPTPPASAGHLAAPPRAQLFVQASADQKPVVDRLLAKLRQIKVAGAPLATPGVEVVTEGGDDSLRCLKTADCGANAKLATEIGKSVGRTIRPIDLSRRYDDDPRVALGTFELWLAPGPLAAPASPARRR